MIWTKIFQNGLSVVHDITHLFVRNYMEKCLRYLLEKQELTDIISCVLLMHMKNRINHLAMMVAAMGIIHYPKIQQQKHQNRSLQPQISQVVGYKPKKIISQNAVIFILIIWTYCFRKSMLNFLNNPFQEKNVNHYYMLLEVVGMQKNQVRSYHHQRKGN